MSEKVGMLLALSPSKSPIRLFLLCTNKCHRFDSLWYIRVCPSELGCYKEHAQGREVAQLFPSAVAQAIGSGRSRVIRSMGCSFWVSEVTSVLYLVALPAWYCFPAFQIFCFLLLCKPCNPSCIPCCIRILSFRRSREEVTGLTGRERRN